MKVAAIVLAGGRASRLGAPKPLLERGGVPIWRSLVRVFQGVPARPIVFSWPPTLAVPIEDGVLFVPSDPLASMVDSIARALVLVGDVDGALVQPVDACDTDLAMCRALLDGPPDEPRCLAFGATFGHPCYVPAAVFGPIRGRPEGGLRTVLEAARVRAVQWPSAAVLADVDTPADARAHGLELPTGAGPGAAC